MEGPDGYPGDQAQLREQDDVGDEMILSAAQYLVKVLEPVSRRMSWESLLIYGLAAVPLVAAAVAAAGFQSFRGPAL